MTGDGDERDHAESDAPRGAGPAEPEVRNADSRERLAQRRGFDAEVYEPAEDSRLLASAAIDHATGLVLEVGTGSGWVADQVAAETDARVVGSDLNPHACRHARCRGVEAVRANLTDPFRPASLDAVLFNPPYLPTDPDAEWDDWVETALSGGESGRAVIDPFLDGVGRVLAPGGVVLLVVSSLAGFEAVVARAEQAGFRARVVREESYPFETLSVVRLD